MAPLPRQRFQFRNHPLRTIRIYQPALQWTMYGVEPTRTQAQPNIRLRPPFKVVWSRGMAGLLVDLRDVPLRLPDRFERRRDLLAAWQADLWPGGEG